MPIKRLITCAALALAAALPVTAAAQAPVTPPDGDNYLAPLFLNDTTSAIPYNTPFGFTADTTAYTTQADMFAPPAGGGPAEPTTCGQSPYGNTIWSVFYSHHWGVMQIDTAGPFDSVIGFVPFRSPTTDPTPLLQFGTCNDSLSGFQQTDAEIVFPGQWWAVQVGGTGVPQGGQLQVKYNLLPPPTVDGQAYLFWKTGPLRVTKLTAKKVTSGAKLTLTCSKHACRRRSVTLKKPVVNKLVTNPGPGATALSGARMKGAPAGSGGRANMRLLARRTAFVHEAAKVVKLIKNRKVKRGAKIELRITEFGFIGKYFRWKVKRNGITSATTRCMNPDSNKPRRRCSG